MPFYRSDLYPLLMRANEALDQRKSLTFAELRNLIIDGKFRDLIDKAGQYPMAKIPNSDWQDIVEALQAVLFCRTNDENEHFFVRHNGYCLLIAVLLEIDRNSASGPVRPLLGP